MSETVKCTVSDEMYKRLQKLQENIGVRTMSSTVEMCIKNGVDKLEKGQIGYK